MAQRLTIDPITRIEGHLRIDKTYNPPSFPKGEVQGMGFHEKGLL